MKNGRYFNFRDICNRNLWDTGYLVKKLQGYGILRPPLMGPLHCFSGVIDMLHNAKAWKFKRGLLQLEEPCRAKTL